VFDMGMRLSAWHQLVKLLEFSAGTGHTARLAVASVNGWAFMGAAKPLPTRELLTLL